jgi:hypothetical protein
VFGVGVRVPVLWVVSMRIIPAADASAMSVAHCVQRREQADENITRVLLRPNRDKTSSFFISADFG